MFSSLKLAVSDLRGRLGARKIEKILFVRLNKSSTTVHIAGLGNVVRELETLKTGQDADAEAAFLTQRPRW